jgi:hypothetical protein
VSSDLLVRRANPSEAGGTDFVGRFFAPYSDNFD